MRSSQNQMVGATRPGARSAGLALLVGSHVGLLVTWNLAAHPAATIGFLAAAFLGLALFLRDSRRAPGLSVRVLLTVAVILRVLLLPLAPTLSDDLLRYVWDGRVAIAGFNPYEVAPEAPELGDLRDSAAQVVPHEDVPTVYPPMALTVFSIAAAFPLSVYVLKLILALVDLIGCFLLVGIAARRGLPISRLAAYAWNPLVTLEIAGMGHVDALGVTATIAAVYWLLPGARRAGSSAAAAAAGVLSKLVPLVALPMWSRQSRRPALYLAVAASVTALAALPLLALGGGIPPGLTRYAVEWEFNGPLFEPMWRLAAHLNAPGVVAAALDGLKGLTSWHEFWNLFYPYRYPQFLAKSVLWMVLLVMVFRSLRWRDPVASTGRLFGAAMLCSATVYPWYLLWILPWAALSRQRAWLALSALIQLSYLPQLLDVELFPWYYLAVWAPFGVLLMANPRWSTD